MAMTRRTMLAWLGLATTMIVGCSRSTDHSEYQTGTTYHVTDLDTGESYTTNRTPVVTDKIVVVRDGPGDDNRYYRRLEGDVEIVIVRSSVEKINGTD